MIQEKKHVPLVEAGVVTPLCCFTRGSICSYHPSGLLSLDMLWFRSPKIYFGCTQCGECCRHMDIQLTHYDLARLLQSETAFALDDLVTLYEGSSENPDAVLLYGHYRLLYLSNRLSDNACIFLQDDNTCRIYDCRPNSCRTWPFSKDVRQQLQIDPSAQPLVMANCEQERYKGHHQMIRTIAQGVEEVRQYWLGIQSWNHQQADQPENQTLANFLLFMWERINQP